MKTLKLTLDELRYLVNKYKKEHRNIGRIYNLDNIWEELNKFLKYE